MDRHDDRHVMDRAADRAPNGAVTGGVRTILRLEGAAVFVVAILAYRQFGLGWGTFALLFLAPDLSFLGYLAGPRVGAAVYNAAHAYVGPIVLLVANEVIRGPVPTWVIGVGLIWAAHIGMDRMLGYGLKYAGGFGATHLGTIGRGRAS